MQDSRDYFWIFIVLAIALLIAVIVVIVRGVIFLLKWLAPVLLIAALIIRHQTVLNFFKWMGYQYRESVVRGLALTILALVMYPLVAALLLVAAIADKKSQKWLNPPFYEEDTRYEDTDYIILDIDEEWPSGSKRRRTFEDD